MSDHHHHHHHHLHIHLSYVCVHAHAHSCLVSPPTPHPLRPCTPHPHIPSHQHGTTIPPQPPPPPPPPPSGWISTTQVEHNSADYFQPSTHPHTAHVVQAARAPCTAGVVLIPLIPRSSKNGHPIIKMQAIKANMPNNIKRGSPLQEYLLVDRSDQPMSG